MDIARLGLAVDSSQVERGTVTLHQLTGAAGAASAAARQLAGASQAEAAGQKAATAATQAHTAALQAQNAAMRMANAQRTNLIFQLNDIGVSLASGMNPLMVLIQQGSQIATIYGGEGGVGRALKETSGLVGGLVARMGPLIGLLALVGAGFAAMAHEVNRTAETNVSAVDMMLASWQLLSEKVAGAFQPVVTAAAQLWDLLSPHIASTVNGIIGAFDLAYRDVVTIWTMLPAALGDVVYQAADKTVNGVIYMVREVQVAINDFITDVNGQLAKMGSPVSIPTMDLMGYATVGNPFAGAAGAYEVALAQNRRDVAGTDYVGMIGARAQEIAAARGEMDALGGSARAANDNVKALAVDGLKSAADRAKELADNLGKSIGGALKDLISGTKDWGTALRDLLLSVGGFLGQQAAGIFGGMGGGMGFFGSILSGLFGGFARGGVFSAGHQIHAFARGGVVDRPTLFPMASGAGLMGEAGPEAIMPLRRGPDGRLGVAANKNGGHLDVRVISEVRGGNLVPVMTEIAGEVSGQQIRQSAPVIVGQAVGQANKSAPAAVARYQQQQAGGDYRVA